MSVTIYNRINESKPKRVKIDGITVDTIVSELRDKVAGCLETDKKEIELLYGGQQLKDEEQLNVYRVKLGVTIHAISKVKTPVEDEPEKISKEQINQVITALQTALINPAFRNIVEKMLSNPETLQNLVATTPGLAKDYIAKAIIQDPELLAMLADPKLVDGIIEKHPSLGQAATFVAAAVSEEAAKGGGASGRTPRGRAHYSMDQMSDEEDMDTDDRRPGFTSSGAPITANQLGAALAALTGAAGGGGSSSQATGGAPGGGSSITGDFLRQAMAATGTAGSSSGQGGVTEAQLSQLREMGITDESVARRALEASGGDVQQALELIFGDGM